MNLFFVFCFIFVLTEDKNEILNKELLDIDLDSVEGNIAVERYIPIESKYQEEEKILSKAVLDARIDFKETIKKIVNEQIEKEKKIISEISIQKESIALLKWFLLKDKKRLKDILQEDAEIFTTDDKDISDDDGKGYPLGIFF